MTRIFICYRRDDSAAYAGRLYDRLTSHFGQGQVFMDIDQIEPGEDFVEAIQRTVGACETALILIGKGWLSAVDAESKRRLDDPDDFVRLEVAAALERKIKVVPVLVGGAAMPKTPQLPELLVPLARRNAIEISDTRFHTDVNRLIEAVEKTITAAPSSTPALPTPETVNASVRASAAGAAQPTPAAQRDIPPPVAEPQPQKPTIKATSAAGPLTKGSKPRVTRNLLLAAIGVASAVAIIGVASRYSPSPGAPNAERSSARDAPSDRAAAYTGLPVKIRCENTFAPGDRRAAAFIAFASELDQATSSRIQVEPLPAGPALKALQTPGDPGWTSVDAVWFPASALYGRNPAFALLGEPPFGPSPARYVQWRRDPKVKAIVDKLYESIFRVGMLCGVTGPGVDLWSRRKIDLPADIKGLKTRAVGLNIDILTAAGLSPLALPSGEIYPALSRGVVDAIQLSDLQLGVALGLPNVTKNLYFPGSLAPTSGVELIFGSLSWEGLGKEGQAAVEHACQRNIEAMLVEGEGVNRDTLNSIASKGVSVTALPVAVVAELRTAWMRVAADKSSDPLFSRLFALTRSPVKGE